MERAKNEYRLTHESLKKEFKKERSKYTSKGKVINIVCVILALVATTLVFIYASMNGLL